MVRKHTIKVKNILYYTIHKVLLLRYPSLQMSSCFNPSVNFHFTPNIGVTRVNLGTREFLKLCFSS